MMSNVPDQQARIDALNPRQSYIVQAPAGSGKTELLTQRYLTLLNHVEKYPEEILAITFTNKAAAEMRARIISKLQLALEDQPPAEAHQLQTWQLAKQVIARDKHYQWGILDNPNRLKIMTIDAFCAQITQLLPILSKFGVQPDINPDANILYESAIDELLTHLEAKLGWSQDIATLLTHLDNDYLKLKRLLVRLLANRDQWLPYVTIDDLGSVKAGLKRALEHIVKQHLVELEKQFAVINQGEFLDVMQYASSKAPDGHFLRSFNDFDYLTAELEHCERWRMVAQFLLTKEGSLRKTVDKRVGFPAATAMETPEDKKTAKYYKATMVDFLNVLRDREPFINALQDMLECPNPNFDEEQWLIIEALINVLPILVAQLTLTFRDAGQVDFSQISIQALTALGTEENPTDLSLALDCRIQHILVDEFQDTSQTQFTLLERLITGWQPQDGRSLFLVGDPMQSIYRFRQAEVGLFLKAQQQGIGAVNLVPLTLTCNFRSSAEIVTWNNNVFSQVFPDNDVIEKGAIKYSHSFSIKPTNTTSRIQCKPFFIAEDNLSSMADYCSELISNYQAEHPEHSIAILVKSRSHLEILLPALQQAGITYQAVEIEPLYSRPVIQDLWHLTRALLYLNDRTAWLALLRAPWCGLTLKDLLILADNNKRTLWQQLLHDEVRAQLSPDGQQRLHWLIPKLQVALEQQGRISLREQVEQLWHDLMGPSLVDDCAALTHAQQFFDLLESQQTHQDLPDLSRFENKLSSLYASSEGNSNAVQVMTIHKSKGLEFDCVIIPSIEKQPNIDQPPLLAWMQEAHSNDATDFLLAPIQRPDADPDPIYQYIRKQNAIKNYHEIQRVLYVACTRAKHQLHLLGNIKVRDNDIRQPNPNSFFGHLWPALKEDIEQQWQEESITDMQQSTYRTDSPQLKRLVLDDIPESDLKPPKLHKNEFNSDFLDISAQSVGTVIHQVVEKIANIGIDKWQTIAETGKQIFYNSCLELSPLNPSQYPRALEKINLAVATMLDDPRGQWILEPHIQAVNEFAFSCLINGKFKHCIIDRSFICDKGLRWIIDYKTAVPENIDLSNFLAQQKKCYSQQLSDYARFFTEHENNTIAFALYFPLCKGWIEWS